MERPNALPFSRRERAAQDNLKIATISRAKRSAGTACSAAATVAGNALVVRRDN
jgi:hypothetical protein